MGLMWAQASGFFAGHATRQQGGNPRCIQFEPTILRADKQRERVGLVGRSNERARSDKGYRYKEGSQLISSQDFSLLLLLLACSVRVDLAILHNGARVHFVCAVWRRAACNICSLRRIEGKVRPINTLMKRERERRSGKWQCGISSGSSRGGGGGGS